MKGGESICEREVLELIRSRYHGKVDRRGLNPRWVNGYDLTS